MSATKETSKNVGVLKASSGTLVKLDSSSISSPLRPKQSIVGIEGNAEKNSASTQDLVGEKGAASVDQDFYKLRDQLYKSSKLFEDPKFPANNDSLYFSQAPKRNIIWKRPLVILFPS